MPEYRHQDTSLWISKNREATFNTPKTLGADFLRATTRTPIVLIPEMEKIDDSNRSGNASEFPTTQCNQYWSSVAAGFADQANFELFGRLGLRTVGGAVATTPIGSPTAIAQKHVAKMLAKSAGLQLPSSTLISELGGATFIFPGSVIDRFRLSQDGVNPVECAFDILGSGKHKSPHGVTSLPAIPAFSCLKPKSYLEYTDTALRDLTVGCRVRSWFVEIANNHTPSDDRCIGDPTQNAGDFAVSGGLSDAAYVSKLTRGNRAISAQIVILLDSTIPEFLQMAENAIITNLTFGARGNKLGVDGTVDVYESLKVVIPNARISTVQEVDSNGKAALTLTFKAMHDADSIGARVEVVNLIATAFD